MSTRKSILRIIIRQLEAESTPVLHQFVLVYQIRCSGHANHSNGNVRSTVQNSPSGRTTFSVGRHPDDHPTELFVPTEQRPY